MANKILFYTEVPTAHLDELHPLIDGHFVIATECLKDQKYLDWYLNRPRDCRIMLDNGMFEEGHPLEVNTLLNLACQLHPDVVFAPDQVGDRYRTLDMSAEFIRKATAQGYDGRIGLIPQGATAEEVSSSYTDLCDLADKYSLSVVFGISFLNDRPKVIECIQANGGFSEYDDHHFLGMYDLSEIASWPDCVVSCDTIKPFKSAFHGHRLETCPRGLGKWNTSMVIDPSSPVSCIMHQNIAKMHRALTRR